MALRRAMANGGLEWRTEVAAAHFRLSRTPRSAADPVTLEAWEEAHDAFRAALIGRCGMPLLLRFHRRLAAAAGMGVDLECMAWRGVNSAGKEMALIAGAPTAAFLVDALHPARCGGTPADLVAIDPARIVAAQLCDAPAGAPDGRDGVIAEARGGRTIPGEGGLPLRPLLAAPPAHAVLSAELPMAADPRPPEPRAAAISAATVALIEPARPRKPNFNPEDMR